MNVGKGQHAARGAIVKEVKEGVRCAVSRPRACDLKAHVLTH